MATKLYSIHVSFTSAKGKIHYDFCLLTVALGLLFKYSKHVSHNNPTLIDFLTNQFVHLVKTTKISSLYDLI